MTERRLTAIDKLITHADQALQTVFGEPVGSERENPSRQQSDGDLTSTDKARSLCLMRVNHAGEVCAKTRIQMEQAAREENDHLVWCRQRIRELGGHTSLLNPVWYTGSLALGAASGAIGDKWSLGFLAETEHQVVKHLAGHLQRLPANDNRSRAILEQMKEDEAKHKATALKAGGAALPAAISKLMTLASRIMTFTAYRI
jgi:ubiquinone biosynthesis monooxygenase Coq7